MSKVGVLSCFISLANTITTLAGGTVVDWPWLVTRCLFITPPSTGQGRKYGENLSWVKLRTGSSLTYQCHKQKSWLGESNLIYCQLLVTEEERMKYNKTKIPFLPPSLLPRLSIIPDSSSSSARVVHSLPSIHSSVSSYCLWQCPWWNCKSLPF